MLNLSLKYKDKVLKDYTFDDPMVISIGRNAENDIVIRDSAVSGKHAQIEFIDNGFLISDLRSKNGIFINDQFVQSHWLADKDIVSIGKHTIIVDLGTDLDSSVVNANGSNKTVFLDSEKYQEMRAKSFLNVAFRGQANMSQMALLTFLEGGEGSFELSKKTTKIGKSKTADIRIKGLFIGKTAVTIDQRPNGFLLNYVSGMKKPRINNRKVTGSMMLKEFDVIQIGSVRFLFQVGQLNPSRRK